MRLLAYFAALPPGKITLWCYLIWYLVSAAALFEPSPTLWLNSAGISLVIGFALTLSVAPSATGRRDRWQTFRLFAMPFCVSSFAALIKGHGYVLVFPADRAVLGRSIICCAAFVGLCWLLRKAMPPRGARSPASAMPQQSARPNDHRH